MIMFGFCGENKWENCWAKLFLVAFLTKFGMNKASEHRREPRSKM